MFRAIISYEARVGETYATDSREEPRYLDMTVPVVNLYQLVAVLSESANKMRFEQRAALLGTRR